MRKGFIFLFGGIKMVYCHKCGKKMMMMMMQNTVLNAVTAFLRAVVLKRT